MTTVADLERDPHALLARIRPVLKSMIDGIPIPTARTSEVIEPSIAAAICSTSSSCEAWLVGTT